MCGIVGYSGRFDPAWLEAGIRCIAHRGPDDSGVFVDREAEIGLGHVRLSIIDLSPLGHQPMWDAAGRAAIVFNGEIYNYRELKGPLEKAGFAFRGHSDTEVLLNLYLAEGEAMLAKLNGIFAFAIWDARTRKLLVARDGVGTKPLYYAETPKGFIFASELKALLLEPSVSRQVDPAAVAFHLAYLWSPSPSTILKAVRKCEPGQALIVSGGKIERKRSFYALPNGRAACWEKGEGAAVAAVRASVETAVARQMVADVPVGAFLSGGLDSSSVAAFAKRHCAGRLQCFTIALEGLSAGEGATDDLPYAQRVARHLDVDLHTIRVGPEMAGELEAMIWQLDEPQADPAPLNALFISRLARRHGIKVLLSGAGGDDIFTGYRRHFALLQEARWSWLPVPFRECLAGTARRLPVQNPLVRRIGRAFAYADWEMPDRLASYFFWLDPITVLGLLHPDLRTGLDSAAIAAPLVQAAKALPAGAGPLDRLLYLEGRYFLADHNLNYTDKMSMAVGVEARVPLLDPDLVELAASLPDGYKQRGRIGKWVFKKAMEPLLPHDVIYRPKTGFGAPLRHWLKHELKPLVNDVLSPGSLAARGLFDPAAVGRLIQRDRAGKVDASYTILALMCIEIWCRLFLEGKHPANRQFP